MVVNTNEVIIALKPLPKDTKIMPPPVIKLGDEITLETMEVIKKANKRDLERIIEKYFGKTKYTACPKELEFKVHALCSECGKDHIVRLTKKQLMANRNKLDDEMCMECSSIYSQDNWLKARANENRAKNNGPERKFLFALMEQKKYRYVYQLPIILDRCKFIADFAVYSTVCKRPIIFEIDGGYHVEESQKSKDKERDKLFNKYGFYVKRITSDRIEGKSRKYIKQIITSTMKAAEKFYLKNKVE